LTTNAIIDPDGPDGKAIALFESGAILIYLAEKSGKLLPSDARLRYETIQWVMWQMGGVGPMFGQYGFFSKFAGKAVEDPLPRERYRSEAVRLMGVLEQRLSTRRWIMDDEYSIADIAIFPWLRGAKEFYDAEEAFEMKSFPSTMAWLGFHQCQYFKHVTTNKMPQLFKLGRWLHQIRHLYHVQACSNCRAHSVVRIFKGE